MTQSLIDQFDAIGRISPNSPMTNFLAPKAPPPQAAEPNTAGPDSLVQALLSMSGTQQHTLASNPSPDVGPGQGQYGAQPTPTGHEYAKPITGTAPALKQPVPPAIAQRGYAP